MKKNNKQVSIKKAKRHKKNLKRLSKKDNSIHYLDKIIRNRADLITENKLKASTGEELELTPEAKESLQKALMESLRG